MDFPLDPGDEQKVFDYMWPLTLKKQPSVSAAEKYLEERADAIAEEKLESPQTK